MTKADVTAVMGRPVSFGADKQSEVMYYRLVEGDIGADIRQYRRSRRVIEVGPVLKASGIPRDRQIRSVT